MTLDQDDRNWIEALVTRILGAAQTPQPQPNFRIDAEDPVVATLPCGLVQTVSMQQHLGPDDWAYINLQDAPGAFPLLTAEQRARILLNTGCNPDGTLDNTHVFGRGFESGSTGSRDEWDSRLSKIDTTSQVFDILPDASLTLGYRLDYSTPLIKSLGMTPRNYPIIHAIRTVAWSHIAEWAKRLAETSQARKLPK